MGMGLTTKLIIGGVVLALAGFLIWRYESNIRSAVYEAFYRKQVEAAMKEQKQENDRLKKLLEEADKAVREAKQERDRMANVLDQIREGIRTGEDGQIAPVLKNTMDSVRGLVGTPGGSK